MSSQQSDIIAWQFADDYICSEITPECCYWSFIHAGDRLAANTFAHLSAAMEQRPEAQIFYSDHDYLNLVGERSLPQFKPSWNFDLQLTTNYVGTTGFWQLTLEQLSDILSGRDTIRCALYNLTTACALATSDSGEVTGSKKIVHIPRVLFRLGGQPNSTLNDDVTLTPDNLISLGLPEQPLFDEHGCLRIHWPLPDEKPLVSLIIPTKNALKLVKTCINSILEKSDYDNFEILLVDNQSDDSASLKYFEQLNQHPKIRVLRYDQPFNYSAINNFAVEQAQGEIIALVNNDIEVIDGNWLTEMVSHAVRPGVGCAGAKLFYSDNTIQHAGVIIGYGGVAGHAHKHFPMHHPGYMNRLQAVQNFSAVTAACLVVKKDIYHQVGGLNERDLTVAFNDVDFCLKVQAAGYRNVWTPYARLYHHESVSRGSDQSGAKLKRFEAEINYMKTTWKTDILPDPAYNPNLTLKREDFSLPE
ncbi:glycosyltransferase family 2 protein [Neiella marina]|uniref:Glycosyltransferase family 2 protein n=1 Tax=Neiella holothuriorum TaxID=2870530 RepID=A0ABS7EEJ6_9GAMM|nr:glycosyltransferase family 2 protein [Neiella holothuriorum]MBW8190738.1 glycosyltransferase family 2 protein [Neiella holothuriorum]